MKAIFKWMVIASLAIYGLYVLLPYLWNSIYDDELLNLLAWDGWKTQLLYHDLLAAVLMMAKVLTSIGLLCLKLWARLAFLALILLNIFLVPFIGVFVQVKYDLMLGYLVALLDGAILAIAYFTSVSREFR